MSVIDRFGVVVYIAVSYCALILYLLDYANAYREFLPTMVALANSSLFKILLTNSAAASVLLMWKVVCLAFFGTLTTSEIDSVESALPIYLFEAIVFPLYFSSTLMSRISALAFTTLVVRMLQQLSHQRIITISVTGDPRVKRRLVARLQMFLTAVTFFDFVVLTRLWSPFHDKKAERRMESATVMIVYCHLLAHALKTYGTLILTLRYAGQRTASAFYMESTLHFLEYSCPVTLFMYVWFSMEFPLLLLRTIVAYVINLADKMRRMYLYTVLTRQMRDIPNATVEDLERHARCSICYDDLLPNSEAKRLSCGHCYHERCLTQWFESSGTCPYCRTTIIPSPNTQVAPEEATPAVAQEQLAPVVARAEAHEPLSPAEAPAAALVQPSDSPKLRKRARADSLAASMIAAAARDGLNVARAYDAYKQEYAERMSQDAETTRVGGASESSHAATWDDGDPSPTGGVECCDSCEEAIRLLCKVRRAQAFQVYRREVRMAEERLLHELRLLDNWVWMKRRERGDDE